MSEKIELKSEVFKKQIYEKLQKNKEEEIFLSDLEIILEIRLDKKDFLKEDEIDIIKELSYFKNLKKCSIVNFNIYDKDFEILNNFNNLIYLEFISCNFLNKLICLNNSNIFTLSFSKCFLNNLNQLGEMKKLRLLRVVNCRDVDLNGIEKLNSLVELYVLNSDVYNAESILKLNNLVYVNFSGSEKIDEETIQSINKKFALTYDDIYVEIEGEGGFNGNRE